ncbi:hypothetical protein [Streptomyces coeruleorubidus]|uniref:hypothetical protein n=1 Tax=Streptomyces coeruleorubidus TaxID=116188 RepID=UPI0033F19244
MTIDLILQAHGAVGSCGTIRAGETSPTGVGQRPSRGKVGAMVGQPVSRMGAQWSYTASAEARDVLTSGDALLTLQALVVTVIAALSLAMGVRVAARIVT